MIERIHAAGKSLAQRYDGWMNRAVDNIRINQEFKLAKKSLEGQMEFVVSRVKLENPDVLYQTKQLYPTGDDVIGTPLRGTDLIQATISFDSVIDISDIDGLGIRTFDTVRLAMFFCDKNGKSVKLMNFHLKDNGRLSFLNAVGGKQGESINKQETTKPYH